MFCQRTFSERQLCPQRGGREGGRKERSWMISGEAEVSLIKYGDYKHLRGEKSKQIVNVAPLERRNMKTPGEKIAGRCV